jgi:hypothetical protein
VEATYQLSLEKARNHEKLEAYDEQELEVYIYIYNIVEATYQLSLEDFWYNYR